jgi:voltage-gated potassium channel Kch
LLQGSGLTFSIGADGTVTLIPRPDNSDVLELGATTVSGQLDGRRDLPASYAGGQVARGANIGLLGNQDMQDVPFAFSSYTSELIETRQALTLADGLWLAFTTAATVGYGDIVPSTPASKIFSVFVVMLGYGVVSLVTAAIATKWVETEERAIEHEVLRDMHRQMDALRQELAGLRQDLAAERTATPADRTG